MCKQTIIRQCDIRSNRSILRRSHAQAVPRADGKMGVKVLGKLESAMRPGKEVLVLKAEVSCLLCGLADSPPSPSLCEFK